MGSYKSHDEQETSQANGTANSGNRRRCGNFNRLRPMLNACVRPAPWTSAPYLPKAAAQPATNHHATPVCSASSATPVAPPPLPLPEALPLDPQLSINTETQEKERIWPAVPSRSNFSKPLERNFFVTSTLLVRGERRHVPLSISFGSVISDKDFIDLKSIRAFGYSANLAEESSPISSTTVATDTGGWNKPSSPSGDVRTQATSSAASPAPALRLR